METFIFLAVTGLLFLIAMVYVGGQQARKEFSTGVRDFDSQMRDIMNDISTGLYANTGDFSCDATAAGPPRIDDTASPTEQGANADCIFLGKAFQFASSDTGPDTIEIYTLIGRRHTDIPPVKNVQTLAEAAPTILDQADTTITLPFKITLKKAVYHGAATVPFGTLALVSTFAGNAGSGGIVGTQDITLVPINGTSLGQLRTDAKTALKTHITTSASNPSGGIELCLNSGGTDEHAILRIGGAGRQAGTILTVGSGVCP